MITKEIAIQRIDAICQRLEECLRHKVVIAVSNESIFGECRALIYAAKSLFHALLSEQNTPYAKIINGLELDDAIFEPNIQANKSNMTTLFHVLGNLRDEIETGMLTTMASQVQATIFDDFIDHADNFLSNKRKNEAGVIAGVTFEDAIRRLCKKHKIGNEGAKIDELISTLARENIINELEAKRARVCGHVRTKATHAQWDEFDERGVQQTIDFVRNCLLLRLAA